MNENLSTKIASLAREAFDEALKAANAEMAVQIAFRDDRTVLQTANDAVRIADFSAIYSVAIGKAAIPMARGLSEILGDRLSEGVISAPKQTGISLPSCWKVFHGGHPLPNEDSLTAATKAIELLKRIDSPDTLIIFLISGGGSAMFENPVNRSISLEDLAIANAVFVSCGAKIGEVNELRRSFSSVKGGRMLDFARQAKKVSLIVSDTNEGEEHNVAAGPTVFRADGKETDHSALIAKYGIADQLPDSIRASLGTPYNKTDPDHCGGHSHSVILSNETLVRTAAEYLNANGCTVYVADDLVEDNVEAGCPAMVEGLVEHAKHASGRPVALVSGGEFSCPVNGSGVGGRNLESALRTAILLDKLTDLRVYGLFGGSDGVDGNSPATGAICDSTSVSRGRRLGLDAEEFLQNSDSYTFFSRLGDTIVTGPTGTNVRDVRILIAE